jgi:hypothetical protein
MTVKGLRSKGHVGAPILPKARCLLPVKKYYSYFLRYQVDDYNVC